MSYFRIHHSLCVLELSAQKQRNIRTQISRVKSKRENKCDGCKSLKMHTNCTGTVKDV